LLNTTYSNNSLHNRIFKNIFEYVTFTNLTSIWI